MKNKIIIYSFIGIVIILFILYVKEHSEKILTKTYINLAEKSINVKISELVKSGKKYNHKIVTFSGYLYTGFEISGIYENPPSRSNKGGLIDIGICVNLNNLISVTGDSIPNSILSHSKGRRILIIGRYDSEETGHLSNCRGKIADIYYLTFL